MKTTGKIDIGMAIILKEAQVETGEGGQGPIGLTSMAMGHEGVARRF